MLQQLCILCNYSSMLLLSPCKGFIIRKIQSSAENSMNPYGNVCMINNRLCVYSTVTTQPMSAMTHTAFGRWDNIHLIPEEFVGAVLCFVIFNAIQSPVTLIK